MNRLVKILAYDPLDLGDDDLQDCDTGWHLVSFGGDSDPSILCSGFVFGAGVSGMKFKLKEVNRGGITCAECLKIVKKYKSIRL